MDAILPSVKSEFEEYGTKIQDLVKKVETETPAHTDQTLMAAKSFLTVLETFDADQATTGTIVDMADQAQGIVKDLSSLCPGGGKKKH